MPAFAVLAFQRVKVCIEVFFDSVCIRRARPLITRWRRCKCISCVAAAEHSLKVRDPPALPRPLRQASAGTNVPAPHISLISYRANQGYESQFSWAPCIPHCSSCGRSPSLMEEGLERRRYVRHHLTISQFCTDLQHTSDANSLFLCSHFVSF